MKRAVYAFFIGWMVGVFVFIAATIVSHAAQSVDLRGYTAGVGALASGRIQGTGFAVATPKGYFVLTNAHVCHIARNHRFRIVFDRGLVTTGKQYALDANKDLCLIEVKDLTFGLPVAPDFVNGEVAYTAGHPEGGPYKEGQGIYGEVVAFPIELWNDFVILAIRREFHGTVVGGQSGSPVVNDRGQVIGVICCSTLNDGTGSFVMLNDVKQFITEGAWL